MLEVFSTGARGHKLEGLHTLSEMDAICATKWSATKYLFEKGVLVKPDECPKCRNCGISFKKDPFIYEEKFAKGLCKKSPSEEKACFIYRCRSRECNHTYSIFQGSLFANSKKPVNQILMFLHLWLTGANIKTLRLLSNWSERCVLSYTAIFRKMVTALINHWIDIEVDPTTYTYEGEGRIGGEGVEVQIDESAFGKRKYGRGHYVDTKWVFGGVEITPDGRGRKKGGAFFAVVVPDRKRESLYGSIKKFIRPGSIIVSDCFKSYDTIGHVEGELSDYQFTHLSVNHSLNYKDPLSGACTNTVEGKWNSLKKNIPRQGFREDAVLQEYLGEQMWRHANKSHLWEAALSTMIAYVKIDDPYVKFD